MLNVITIQKWYYIGWFLLTQRPYYGRTEHGFCCSHNTSRSHNKHVSSTFCAAPLIAAIHCMPVDSLLNRLVFLFVKFIVWRRHRFPRETISHFMTIIISFCNWNCKYLHKDTTRQRVEAREEWSMKSMRNIYKYNKSEHIVNVVSWIERTRKLIVPFSVKSNIHKVRMKNLFLFAVEFQGIFYVWWRKNERKKEKHAQWKM